MQYFYKALLCVSLLGAHFSTFAIEVTECEDASGERSFQKTCPPGTTEISRKKLSVGNSAKGNAGVNVKVTLYAVADCDPCEDVRDFLKARDIAYEEKNAAEDLDIQQELTDLAGAVKVPTIVIGDEVISGYQRAQMKRALGLTDSKPDQADAAVPK